MTKLNWPDHISTKTVILLGTDVVGHSTRPIARICCQQSIVLCCLWPRIINDDDDDDSAARVGLLNGRKTANLSFAQQNERRNRNNCSRASIANIQDRRDAA